MKKMVMVLAMAALVAAGASSAMAADNAGVYGAIYGGTAVGGTSKVKAASNHTIDYDAGYAVSGAIGYKFGMGLRTELELGYQNTDVKNIDGIATTGSLSMFNTMINAWYDIDTKTAFTPYIGGGIGVALPWQSAGASLDQVGNSTFAYQAGVGILYDVTKNLALDVSYRYRGFTETNFGDYKADNQSHNIVMGAMFRF